MPARGYSTTPKAKAKAKAKPKVPSPTHTLPDTPEAIRGYQKFHKLPPTGRVDPATGAYMQKNRTRLGTSPEIEMWRRRGTARH